jgi:hypothetical protein
MAVLKTAHRRTSVVVAEWETGGRRRWAAC